jgi:hypothetical protein
VEERIKPGIKGILVHALTRVFKGPHPPVLSAPPPPSSDRPPLVKHEAAGRGGVGLLAADVVVDASPDLMAADVVVDADLNCYLLAFLHAPPLQVSHDTHKVLRHVTHDTHHKTHTHIPCLSLLCLPLRTVLSLTH